MHATIALAARLAERDRASTHAEAQAMARELAHLHQLDEVSGAALLAAAERFSARPNEPPEVDLGADTSS